MTVQKLSLSSPLSMAETLQQMVLPFNMAATSQYLSMSYCEPFKSDTINIDGLMWLVSWVFNKASGNCHGMDKANKVVVAHTKKHTWLDKWMGKCAWAVACIFTRGRGGGALMVCGITVCGGCCHHRCHHVWHGVLTHTLSLLGHCYISRRHWASAIFVGI